MGTHQEATCRLQTITVLTVKYLTKLGTMYLRALSACPALAYVETLCTCS